MTTPSRTAYPYAVVRLPNNWAAGSLQWTSAITARSRDELERMMREDVALHLFYAAQDGEAVAPPIPREKLDLSDYVEAGAEQPFEVVYTEPEPMSLASISILEGLRLCGVNKAELARRMGVTRAVVSRITDPFYFGHRHDTVARAAEALGLDLRMRMERPKRRRAVRKGGPDPYEAVPAR